MSIIQRGRALVNKAIQLSPWQRKIAGLVQSVDELNTLVLAGGRGGGKSILLIWLIGYFALISGESFSGADQARPGWTVEAGGAPVPTDPPVDAWQQVPKGQADMETEQWGNAAPDPHGRQRCVQQDPG